MRTWSRQLSTLPRSSCSRSRVVNVSSLPRRFGFFWTNPPRKSQFQSRSRPTHGRVHLGLQRGLALLGGREGFFEPGGEVADPFGGGVVLRLGRAGDVADPALKPVGGHPRHVGDSVGDVLLRLAGELLDRLLELARQAIGSLLPGPLALRTAPLP